MDAVTKGNQADKMIKKITNAIKKGSLFLIKAYQLTRSMRSSCCRFYPSCSDYCAQAIQSHGLITGIGLGIKRLLKCHPGHQGGIDLVELS